MDDAISSRSQMPPIQQFSPFVLPPAGDARPFQPALFKPSAFPSSTLSAQLAVLRRSLASRAPPPAPPALLSSAPMPLNLPQHQTAADGSASSAAPPPPAWPVAADFHVPPTALYVPAPHVARLRGVHAALDKALESVVNRWFGSPGEEGFWRRMPLPEHEEAVLRWIATSEQGREALGPWEGARKGCWRADFLVEKASDSGAERLRICELNARMPFNAYFLNALIQESLIEAAATSVGTAGREVLGRLGLRTASPSLEQTTKQVLSLFDTDKPVHIVLGEKDWWPGIDVHWFAKYFAEETGQRARFVRTDKLRLVESKASVTGYELYCVVENEDSKDAGGCSESLFVTNEAGEALERVHQVSLELFQSALATLSRQLLNQLAVATRANDLRGLLLVNDARLLGIVWAELDDLEKRRVLTKTEIELLKQALPESHLPSDAKWETVTAACRAELEAEGQIEGVSGAGEDAVAESAAADAGAVTAERKIENGSATTGPTPREQDNWVLKASRGAFSQGHIFGIKVSRSEWVRHMDTAQRCNSSPVRPEGADADASFVLQRHIVQAEMAHTRHATGPDETWGGKEEGRPCVESRLFVGSSCTVKGEFTGLGAWRVAEQPPQKLNEWQRSVMTVAFTDAGEGSEGPGVRGETTISP